MYTVPIIAPDLRHEETIIQAAHALNVLQETIDNVFQRLDARIAVSSAKAKELGMRIQSADERIRKLVGVKKALQIYAPARYPAVHLLRDPLVTFGRQQQQTQKQVDDKYEIKSRFESIHPESRHEKLVFFHLTTPTNVITLRTGALSEHITAARSKLNSNGHTLGAPPQNLRSIAALLRFNSEEEAYKRQNTNEQSAVRPDSWRRAKMPKNQPKPQKKLLEPAPHSLANRNQRATPAGDLRYMPKMHEAPIIDLPMDLPSLDGVAQDIHFMDFGNANLHIKIHKGKSSEDAKQPRENSTAAEQLSIEVLDTITTITPILKPKAVLQETASAPAPPPPPPPPPAKTPATTSSSVSNNEAQPLPKVGNDTRSALMDAIRQAGGARGGRLRSAAAAPVDVTDNKKTPAPSCGNLMEDLHNKLLMRRKGISGSSSFNSIRTENSRSGNPVLQRLSALIPPPPSKQQHSDDNTEDGDWE